jgi:hypothetical protein
MKHDADELDLLLQKLRWLRLPGMLRIATEIFEEAAKKNWTALDVMHLLRFVPSNAARCAEVVTARLFRRAVPRAPLSWNDGTRNGSGDSR